MSMCEKCWNTTVEIVFEPSKRGFTSSIERYASFLCCRCDVPQSKYVVVDLLVQPLLRERKITRAEIRPLLDECQRAKRHLKKTQK